MSADVIIEALRQRSVDVRPEKVEECSLTAALHFVQTEQFAAHVGKQGDRFGSRLTTVVGEQFVEELI